MLLVFGFLGGGLLAAGILLNDGAAVAMGAALIAVSLTGATL